MHGFPWWFGLLFMVEFWIAVGMLLIGGVFLLIKKFRNRK